MGQIPNKQLKTSMVLLPYLERQSKVYLLLLSYGVVVVLGLTDYLTGPELAFSVFYFIPVAIATYFVNRNAGLIAAVVSAIIWAGADIAVGHTYMQLWTPYWNTLMRLLSFVVVALLLAALRGALDHEQQLARFDFLTGASNARSFYELTNREISRSRRYSHPFTVTHLDVDNFKTVNDTLGHAAGDDVLRQIVLIMQHSLRDTDVVARLGGDEFAILLPETGAEEAQQVVQKIQQKLMAEMHGNQIPVSFSFGVLTCLNPTQSVDDLLKKADRLTYAAKDSGKNTVKYEVVTQDALTQDAFT